MSVAHRILARKCHQTFEVNCCRARRQQSHCLFGTCLSGAPNVNARVDQQSQALCCGGLLNETPPQATTSIHIETATRHSRPQATALLLPSRRWWRSCAWGASLHDWLHKVVDTQQRNHLHSQTSRWRNAGHGDGHQ